DSVSADRFHAQGEFFGNLSDGLARGDHTKNLILAIGENLVRSFCRFGVQVEYQLFSKSRTNVFPATDNFTNCLDEFCRSAFFREVTRGPGSEDSGGVLILGMHTQDEYRQFGRFRMQLLQYIQTVLVRHCDVEQYDIPRFALNDFESFVAVTRFRSNSHSGILGNDSLQALANDGMIIDDANFDHSSARPALWFLLG